MFKDKSLRKIALATGVLAMTVGMIEPIKADTTSGGGSCNLCKLTGAFGITVFSCKPMEKTSCSGSHSGYTLTCADAVKC